MNLKKFKEHSFDIDAGNISDFDLQVIISGLDHLVKVHKMFSTMNRPLVQEYFAHRVHCDAGSECRLSLDHVLRKREYSELRDRDVQKTRNVDAINSLCEVTSNALSETHCFVLHSGNVLHRISGNDDEEKDDVHSNQELDIDFGVSPLRWLPYGEHPEFDSFRDEIVNNPQSTIDELPCLSNTTWSS